MTRDTREDDSPVGDLLMRIAGGAFRLVQGEIALRKAEAREIAMILLRAAVVIIVAIVLALLGLGQLTDAVHAALVLAGMQPVWASVLTGALLCLIAAGLIWWQLRRIRRAPFLARMRVFASGAMRPAQERDLAKRNDHD